MEDQDYKTYTAPEVIDAKPLYTEQPKQKSNTWWIVLLVILLLLCCCLVIGGAVVFFMVASGQYRIDWGTFTPLLNFV